MKDWKEDLASTRNAEALESALNAMMVFGYGFASGALVVLLLVLP